MKKTIILISILASSSLYAEGISDKIANAIARIALSRKVNGLYHKALACTPLEIDRKNNLNVTDWLPLEPEVPQWQMLNQFSLVAKEARDYALTKRGSDKVLHCYAGCYVSRKLDLASGIYIGWYKELVDASDCSVNSHFEKADFEATHAGAIIASKGIACEDFCSKEEIKNLDGDKMLEAAERLE
jgi:hypothetical protein